MTLTEAQVQEEFRIGRDDVEKDRRASVLNSNFLRQWFLQHGYTLCFAYQPPEGSSYIGFRPQATPEFAEDACFPYARHGGDDNMTDRLPALLAPIFGRVLFAQDAQLRHIAIKIVQNASSEYEILRFLSEQDIPNSKDKFNYIIPVLDILPFSEFHFVVMPRWGRSFSRPPGPTMKEVLRMLHSLLKGLVYLHRNRIVHGDISIGNIVVDHFGRYMCDHKNPVRRYLKQQGQLSYALLDFDLSTKFPPSWSNEQCRLPYKESFKGTPGFVPPDTWQGEFDFDPFALDVGALGLVFSGLFDHLTVHVPMLAPLFDKMLTRDIPRRFTAQKALRFLEEEEVYPRTTSVQLDMEVVPRPSEQPDRWEALDPSFLAEWADYHEPPLPRHTKFLRFVCEYRWILHTVAFMRRCLHTLKA